MNEREIEEYNRRFYESFSNGNNSSSQTVVEDSPSRYSVTQQQQIYSLAPPPLPYNPRHSPHGSIVQGDSESYVSRAPSGRSSFIEQGQPFPPSSIPTQPLYYLPFPIYSQSTVPYPLPQRSRTIVASKTVKTVDLDRNGCLIVSTPVPRQVSAFNKSTNGIPQEFSHLKVCSCCLKLIHHKSVHGCLW